MAITTSTMTATTLALSAGGLTTTLNKAQLDSLLTLVGATSSTPEGTEFTEEEKQVLKKFANMPGTKRMVNATDTSGSFLTSSSLARIELVNATPEVAQENTFYIITDG